MKSQRIPMTIAEFHALPRKFGWKYEYYDGKAHIQPRHQAVVARVPVTPRPATCSFPLRPVLREDVPTLIEAFLEAFAATVEYCDWKPDAIARSARQCVESSLAGARGAFMDVSRMALEATGAPAKCAGAALVVRTNEGPMLDLLLVRPAWQRQGLATALVGAVLNELYAMDCSTLVSRYDVANEPSVAWHHRFGFVEEEDLMLAESRQWFYGYEIYRKEQIGELNTAERQGLESQREYWAARAAALQDRAEREGWDAVTPLLRIAKE